MQQNRLEEMNLSVPVCDQQLLCSEYEGRTRATWLAGSSLGGGISTQFIIMPAAGLETSTPACLPQHSYKKEVKLMILCVKHNPARCSVYSSVAY